MVNAFVFARMREARWAQDRLSPGSPSTQIYRLAGISQSAANVAEPSAERRLDGCCEL